MALSNLVSAQDLLPTVGHQDEVAFQMDSHPLCSFWPLGLLSLFCLNIEIRCMFNNFVDISYIYVYI